MGLTAFTRPGRFWRGNLHTHSTLSDGTLEPAEVCSRYREVGYDFMALTDHFMERYGFPIADTRAFRSQHFTTIIGAELHTGYTELGFLWHILAVGLPLGFAPYATGETGPDISRRALETGAFVAVAHPAWYGLTEADVTSLGGVHAIEVYNCTSADYNDRPDSLYMLDLMLMRGRRYMACATDDAHFVPRRHDFTRGWVYAKSEALDESNLLAALKEGAYYSSTGPQIQDVQLLRAGKVRVRCSPVDRIIATGYGSYMEQACGHGITEGEVDIRKFEENGYFRITLRDSSGNRAWSNPIWL